MKKISIIDYAKMISESRGDDADAVLLLRINDGDSQISIIGLDEMLISPTAIKMAITLQRLLDTDMSAAAKLGKSFRDCGFIEKKEAQRGHIQLKPDEIPFFKADEQKEPQRTEDDDNGSSDDKQHEKEALQGIVTGLLDLIFGGEHDEDDD